MNQFVLPVLRATAISFVAVILCGCTKSRITGTVVDTSGKPISEAEITVEGTQFQAKTDKNGEYSVGFVPGSFSINVVAANYCSKAISFNVTQAAKVPAAPVRLPALPDRNLWRNYLTAQLLERSTETRDFYGFGDNVTVYKLGEFVSVKQVEIGDIHQMAEFEVTATVVATYIAKLQINPDSRAAEAFQLLAGFRHSYRPGEAWKHHFLVKLKFADAATWTWTDTLAADQLDETIQLSPQERQVVEAARRREVDPGLVRIAAELNKGVPMIIDKETRLDSASASPNRTLVYHYTLVNLRSADVQKGSFEQRMRPNLISNYRTNPQMQNLRDDGVTLEYQYVDKEGDLVSRIAISPKDF